jgi:hypothetical protein
MALNMERGWQWGQPCSQIQDQVLDMAEKQKNSNLPKNEEAPPLGLQDANLCVCTPTKIAAELCEPIISPSGSLELSPQKHGPITFQYPYYCDPNMY